MPRDRRSNSVEELRQEFRRLERLLVERSRSRSTRRRPRSVSLTPPHRLNSKSRSRSRSRSRSSRAESRSPSPIIVIEEAKPTDSGPREESLGAQPATAAETKNTELVPTEAEEFISEDVLALLGDAPEEIKYGPDLLTQITTRWEAVIKKGLPKEEKTKIMKKYPAPGNCRLIEVPKLNPEPQAAIGENLIKRDKAIEEKQKGVSCALSALGLALNKLCKSPGNDEVISLLSDSARLLCDYHHIETSVRKQFIIKGLDNKIAREALNQTEVDQWLFGGSLSDKLKTSKAIDRSGKDLKGPPSKPKKSQATGNLNYKGPGNNSYKPKAQGQKSAYHPYQRKPGNTSAKTPQQRTPRPQRYNNRR